jgi:rod shape-determining protein MreC
VLSFLKRNRRTLFITFLLLYPFARFLTARGQTRDPNFIDRAVLWTTGMGESLLSHAVDGTVHLAQGYVLLRQVHAENLRLVSESQELKRQNQTLQEAQLENARLRKLLGYSEANPGVKVSARVLGVNPVTTLLSLRLDRGENDGIRRGMPVVTADGIVGSVVRATTTTADVMLVSDFNSRVGGRIERSRARVTAAGMGELHNLKLDNALRTEDVAESDIVVTSGADGVYPAGLIIGKVKGVQQKGSGMFQEGQIVPSVDPAKVEEVFVLSAPSFPPVEALMKETAAPSGGKEAAR